MNRRQSPRQSAGSSLYRPGEKIANPYAIVKPFDIVLHKLSPEFIDDALLGNITWSFPRGRGKVVDWESYFREKMARANQTVVVDESNDDQRSNKVEKSKKKRRDPVITSDYENGIETEIDNHEDSDEVEEHSTSRKRSRPRRSQRQIPIPVPEQFKCKQCSYSTDEADLLAVHAKVHKNVCNDCNLTFPNVYKYQKHVYEIHKPPVELKYNVVYGCKICNEYFDDEGCANLHISGHIEASEDGKFACMLCNVTFARENGVTKHLVSKHMYYKCTFCDLLAVNFENLERHSQSAHSAFGKPYACDLCDFRSAVFGTLLNHRKISHGLEREGDHERCRFCAYLLINDREVILEHLAGHIDAILFECRHCENLKTSSFAVIREHGINFHATDVISSYAKVLELNEMANRVKALLNRSKGKSSAKKGERPKPTNTETKDAIAGIYIPEEKLSLDSILDSSMKHSDDMYNPPSFQMPVATSPIAEQPDSSCDPSFNYYSANEDLLEPQQCTYVGSQDPLSTAMQSIAPNGTTGTSSVQVVPQTSEGVLSVDPVTGQLFLQGLPVMDEKGNPILVALQGTCLAQPQMPTQQNSEPLDNGGTSSYQPNGNGFLDSNSLSLNGDSQYQGDMDDPFMGGNTLENG